MSDAGSVSLLAISHSYWVLPKVIIATGPDKSPLDCSRRCEHNPNLMGMIIVFVDEQERPLTVRMLESTNRYQTCPSLSITSQAVGKRRCPAFFGSAHSCVISCAGRQKSTHVDWAHIKISNRAHK